MKAEEGAGCCTGLDFFPHEKEVDEYIWGALTAATALQHCCAVRIILTHFALLHVVVVVLTHQHYIRRLPGVTELF